MITNVRSFILCGAIDFERGGMADYRAVINSQIIASQRPVLFDAWLAIQIELDGKPTPWSIHLQLPGGVKQQGETREIPTGRPDADIRIPVFVPLTEEGDLKVTLTDLSRKPKSWECRWRVRFEEGHRVLNPAELPIFEKLHMDELKRRAAATAEVIKLPPR